MLIKIIYNKSILKRMEWVMAKKKQNNQMALILNVVVIVLAILTVVTLFMPIFKRATILGDTETLAVSAKGLDCFTAAFNGEVNLADFTDGANMLIGLRVAEEGAFIADVMIWGYILTVIVAVATLVFAVLGLLGMKFNMITKVLGGALVVLALVTLVFGLIAAGKNTELTEVLGKKNGPKATLMVAGWLMIASIVAGGTAVCGSMRK